MDDRDRKLAKNLVNYSCGLKKGEKILISLGGTAGLPLARQIIKEVYEAGGLPYAEMNHNALTRELLLGATEEQYAFLAGTDAEKMDAMDAYIAIRAHDNPSELSDVPSEKLKLYNKTYVKSVHHDVRLKKKWVVLQYPNSSMAQDAGTSLEAFTAFFYQVCNLDYAKMSAAMDALKTMLDETDLVQIKGPGTDLSFSVKGIPSVKCDGRMNIPDGEVYTAPVKYSVNGRISFNTRSEHEGFVYENIVLTFQNGKIVKATANDDKKINAVLDSDEGARYIGEFAIGVNPYILHPMKNTLFDEKIMGSLHFTPGNCYDDADNGNKSIIHWDLVLIQTEQYGGGEIYFDGKLVRKDGRFVWPALLALNPEKLIG